MDGQYSVSRVPWPLSTIALASLYGFFAAWLAIEWKPFACVISVMPRVYGRSPLQNIVSTDTSPARSEDSNGLVLLAPLRSKKRPRDHYHSFRTVHSTCHLPLFRSLLHAGLHVYGGQNAL